MYRYSFVIGDITKINTEAIVNSANTMMVKGSGICKSIFEAAGEKELTKESVRYAPLEEGQAIVTNAYNLPCKYIIHTVTPKYYINIGSRKNIEKLSLCYASILKRANELKLKEIAIPCIGIGHHAWPLELSVNICFDTIEYVLENHPEYSIENIIFVCVNEKHRYCYYDRAMRHG